MVYGSTSIQLALHSLLDVVDQASMSLSIAWLQFFTYYARTASTAIG